MRNNPTEPEKRLWRHLSNSQLAGHKFRRQSVIAPFIADFLCPRKTLIIEVDGNTHEELGDRKRDEKLQALGYHILRFTNQDVMHNMDGVLQMIVAKLDCLPDRWAGMHHPNPSSKEEGL